MNRTIKITGIALIALFIILIFFSQTIYNYNTPTVTAVLPSNGKLDKKEKATGLTDWSKTRDIYVSQSGVIEEVYTEDGDTVEAGTHIAKMAYDTYSILDQIAGLAINRDKLLLGVETSQTSIEKLNRQIKDLNEDVYTSDDVSDYAILQAEAKIFSGQTSLDEAQANLDAKKVLLKDAQDQLSYTQALYDVGGMAQSDLDAAVSAVDAAQRGMDTAQRGVETASQNLMGFQLDLQNQKNVLAKTQETNTKTISDKEKSRSQQIADLQYQISAAEKDIAGKQLDIKNIDLQTASYQRQLKDLENAAYINAPESGTMLSLSLQPGQTVNKGQSVASMAVDGAYTITCQISLDNNFVAVGDQCKLSNTDQSLVATVSKITLTNTGKQLELKANSDSVSSGETFEVNFEKESAQSAVLIPNGAVNQDSEGYFVYMIKKRKGMLGDEYYADKVPIYIGDSDDQNTIMTQGMRFFEPIALLSDKPFTNGDTVKVKNEGDFFAS